MLLNGDVAFFLGLMLALDRRIRDALWQLSADLCELPAEHPALEEAVP